MAPNVATGVLFEEDKMVRSSEVNAVPPRKRAKGSGIVWRNVLLFLYLHMAALYGLYLVFTSAKLLTTLFAYSMYIFGGLGITGGAHRLWAHKSYKAKLPLRIFLMIGNTLAFQNCIWEWARDHRVHHKFSETDADPHNAKRGIFFSHIGWLLTKKHPDVAEKGKTVDLSDLLDDPVVAFQKKYYLILMPFICFVIPTMIPVYLWGETGWNSFLVASILRYCVTLNITWLVNSVAHFYGSKPFDKDINPAQNLGVALTSLGEGWHNYHHVFPWDYKTAELGNYRANLTTGFIDLMAWLGQAYDMKTVSPNVIVKRANRTGDGSYVAPSIYERLTRGHDGEEHSHEGEVWGWDDKDMKEEDRDACMVLNKED